jgi:SAM-dependent methyltransferase
VSSPCVICGRRAANPLFDRLRIVKCPCGHIYYDGSETETDILNQYDESYFKGRVYADYEKEREIIQRNFRNRLKFMEAFVRNGKLLEIGSAYGFFLDLAREKFDTVGFEACVEAAKHAQEVLQLDVRSSDFLKTNLTREAFDAACLFDCIEHLVSPQLFIEKLNSVLKVNGYLFITTGDVSSPLARLQRENWRLIDPPLHIHYFTRKSLTTLLERYGFEVVKIKYPGAWRSNAQLVLSLLGNEPLANRVPGSFWINTFDIMEVAAKKVGGVQNYQRKIRHSLEEEKIP